MLAGLSTKDALALGSLALGDFLLVCGLVALLRRPVYVDHETRHVIEVKSRFFKEVRAKYAAVIAVLVGAGLVVFPIWTHPRTPPTVLISGTVLIQGGYATPGLVVGILPGSHTTFTRTDGRYVLSISKATPRFRVDRAEGSL